MKFIIIMLDENTALYMIAMSEVGDVALITPGDNDDRKDAIV